MKKLVLTILFFSMVALCVVDNASAQVSNVKAVYDSDTSVLVTWTFTGPPSYVEIAKSTSSAGPFTVLTKLYIVESRSGSSSYKDTSVNKLVKPFYRVSTGKEATPPIVQATTQYEVDRTPGDEKLGTLQTSRQDPRKAPTDVVATAGNGQVALTWGTKSAGTTYNVKSSLSSAGPFNVIKSQLTSPSFTVTGLPNGTLQYFVVSAVFDNQESPNSLAVSATPNAPAVKLGAPTGLAGQGIDATEISLSWNALAGATSYSIKMAKASGGPYTTLKSGLTTTSFDATGLTRSTTYYFVVSANNALGESPNSPQIQVATPNFIR